MTDSIFYRPTPEDINTFREKGYIVVPSLLAREETSLLEKIAKNDNSLRQEIRTKEDGQGGITTLTVRNTADDNTYYGAISCSERIVVTMTAFLDGEAYAYHYKVNMKEPHGGGAWLWHQDHGYWQRDGLRPDMASVMIAIDKATLENGCLQVIPYSHTQWCRTLPHHEYTPNQLAVIKLTVDDARNEHDVVPVELNPGDGVFFHSRLLHTSAQNTSDKPRWVLITSYNRSDNFAAVENPRHPDPYQYSVVPDREVVPAGKKHLEILG